MYYMLYAEFFYHGGGSGGGGGHVNRVPQVASNDTFIYLSTGCLSALDLKGFGHRWDVTPM